MLYCTDVIGMYRSAHGQSGEWSGRQQVQQRNESQTRGSGDGLGQPADVQRRLTRVFRIFTLNTTEILCFHLTKRHFIQTLQTGDWPNFKYSKQTNMRDDLSRHSYVEYESSFSLRLHRTIRRPNQTIPNKNEFTAIAKHNYFPNTSPSM